MSTRNTLFTKPVVEIDQDRYEELVRHELQYEQYKACADEGTRTIIETNVENKLIESEENE